MARISVYLLTFISIGTFWPSGSAYKRIKRAELVRFQPRPTSGEIAEGGADGAELTQKFWTHRQVLRFNWCFS